MKISSEFGFVGLEDFLDYLSEFNPKIFKSDMVRRFAIQM
jgi:hypothetical protein